MTPLHRLVEPVVLPVQMSWSFGFRMLFSSFTDALAPTHAGRALAPTFEAEMIAELARTAVA